MAACKLEMDVLASLVRRRPGMFFGDVASREAIHLVCHSLLANAVHFRGATRACLSVGDDGTLTLDDNGGPLDDDWNKWTLLSNTADCHPKWLTAPGVVDLAVTAAGAHHFTARTESGLIQLGADAASENSAMRHARSSRVRCRMARDVFRGNVIPDVFHLFGWARDYASTEPGIEITIATPHLSRVFSYPHGIVDRLREENACRHVAHGDPIQIVHNADSRRLDVALTFCLTGPLTTLSFVNHERTIAHGVHVIPWTVL